MTCLSDSTLTARLFSCEQNNTFVANLRPSDLNAVVMDYLISEGYPSAAHKFASEANIQPTSAVDSIQERVAIREAIFRGDIQSAIERINELNPMVRPPFSLPHNLPHPCHD